MKFTEALEKLRTGEVKEFYLETNNKMTMILTEEGHLNFYFNGRYWRDEVLREYLNTNWLPVEEPKKQTFPIVFEDDYYKIEVKKNGIGIFNKEESLLVGFYKSLDLLYKAVECSKEISGK